MQYKLEFGTTVQEADLQALLEEFRRKFQEKQDLFHEGSLVVSDGKIRIQWGKANWTEKFVLDTGTIAIVTSTWDAFAETFKSEMQLRDNRGYCRASIKLSIQSSITLTESGRNTVIPSLRKEMRVEVT